VLVVIVIFLVGILAIVQIFPYGFKILMSSRNSSVSSALARDLVERLKANADNNPEMIVPVTRAGGAWVVDPAFNTNGYGVMGDRLLPTGLLRNGASTVGPWQYFSGPNAVRRVIGEGGRVPAPRMVGASNAYYGGLMVLQFGPIDYVPATGTDPANLSVYGNDLTAHQRDVDNGERWSDGEYFIANATNSGVTVRIPSGASARRYHVSFSAYVQKGTNYVKRDYVGLLPLDVPASTPDPSTGMYPLYSQPLAGLISDVLGTVDLNTLRVSRAFAELAPSASFSNDPYEFKLIDNAVGVLLFNPVASSVYVSGPNGRQPLAAKVDYDVYDWRILKEDFRLAPSGGTQQHKLAVGSMKVWAEVGTDGLRNTRIEKLEEVPPSGYTDDSEADEARADNFVVLDVDTGGIVMERQPSAQKPPEPATSPLITVNKSNGVVTFHDADDDASNGTTGKILLPDKSIQTVPLENRALRAMYRTKGEFAVQVLKAASRYTVSATSQVGIGQYYVGGSNGNGVATRLYFPIMDAGRKVTIGEVNYTTASSTQQILGQDFVIRFRQGDPLGLPSVDISESDVAATGFSFATGAAVKDVRGASVAVRVSWNPDQFFLTSDTIENMRRLEKWAQSWRHSTNETFLDRSEVAR